VRILECDDINAPAGSHSTFRVSRVDELDVPGKAPLVLDLDPDGSGAWLLPKHELTIGAAPGVPGKD